jgi:hypothetical protein
MSFAAVQRAFGLPRLNTLWARLDRSDAHTAEECLSKW